ncbi:MTH895/ArsE family thioredoxin-like protein [Thiomicrorhabdus cannonii]|uniref:MTH895/ArsE family thioredoxin-like protein n=1 Tax=Thiomicrorhabdus cannonii TaxID=2748011 RepID=UPI0024842725|nr:MTH895/ArsE family thioredoxin-like protein [Thiomicrorhabdus cannonii]
MTIAVKGNRPLRFFAVMMLVLLAVSHFMGQIDLTKVSFLWLMILMAVNAIQASFTGFCPMFKNARGECVACGVVCDAESTAKSGGCCSDNNACCESEKTAEKTQQAGCCGGETGCCGDSEPKTACCDSSSNHACCGSDALVVKVLGTGCATCNNTAALIEQVAEKLDREVCIVKVEDVAEIAAYGVMSTPAIVMDEKVVHAGGMPSAEQVETWLKAAD